jgi:cellulose synthase/poly-beta-1,6-N-acetylglucosamine synthase-like glycosyltransferase
MVSLANALLVVVSATLFVPALVYFIECFIAVFRGNRPYVGNSPRPKVAVVVPAHNEEGTVGQTVAHLAAQLSADDRLIVVADNCSDGTAREAAEAGAEAWVREDADRRGKGYAISFAISRLSADPPPVVILIDADCRIEDGLIDRIASATIKHNRPIQSRYLFDAPPGSGRMSQISAFACLVRNHVRPLGMKYLGFPCHLTGSGMAFRWDHIASAPGQAGNIVEDLSLGLEMAIAGHEPMLCEDAVTRSDLPGSGQAAKTQRQRWEHGQMATLVAFVPRLFRQAVSQRRVSLLALALDLAVPPLAFLVLLNVSVSAVNVVFGILFGDFQSLVISLTALLLIGTATLAAWARYGRETVPGSVLLSMPFYVLWKLPLYVAALLGRRQKDWVRTDRNAG